MPTIVLSHLERDRADRVAQAREREAERAARRSLYGAASRGQSEQLAMHILGARGELAFAILSGLDWDESVNTFHTRPDVGIWHVRTRSRPHYDLIIRDSDPPGLYALMTTTGDLAAFTLRGAIRSERGRSRTYRRNYGGHGPAYFVPQSALTGVQCAAGHPAP